jgi:hypothetical protein
MKYTVFLITILATVFFSNCSKKDLPEPDPLNAQNTSLSQQNTGVSVTAPCASQLVNNKISFSVYSDGAKDMGFFSNVNPDLYEVDISCIAHASYNTINISLPLKRSFLGNFKYNINGLSYTSNTSAVITHRVGSYYYATSYIGYEGSIYAEYTKTQIILSFCDVKVKDSYSNEHTITGKVTIDNNF